MKVGLPLFLALLTATSASAAGAPACGKYSSWQGSIESGGKQIGDSVTADFEHGSYSAHDMTIPAMAGGDIANVKCAGNTLQFEITNMHPLTKGDLCVERAGSRQIDGLLHRSDREKGRLVRQAASGASEEIGHCRPSRSETNPAHSNAWQIGARYTSW